MVDVHPIKFIKDNHSAALKAGMIFFGGGIYLLSATLFSGVTSVISILLARTGGFGFMMGSWIAYLVDVSGDMGTTGFELVLTVVTMLFVVILSINFIVYFTQITGLLAAIATIVVTIGGGLGAMIYVWTAFLKPDTYERQAR